MNAESLSRIDSFLSSSVSDLFLSHGLHLEPKTYDAQTIEEPFAATIGFTSEKMRGVLVLLSNRKAIEQSLPKSLKIKGVNETIVADWTGELSNQILGRLKNHLCSVGIDIALSTPTVFAGMDLRHFAHPAPINRKAFFEGEGTILAEFQAECDAALELGEPIEGRDTSTPEDEVLFF